MLGLQKHLEAVRHRVQAASQGREGITLIAVSKRHPLQALLDAYGLGVRTFGENRVQEARDKRPSLPPDAEIHLIGPLQANKAKYCPELFTWVHSLHRIDIAQELNRRCGQKGSSCKCWYR